MLFSNGRRPCIPIAQRLVHGLHQSMKFTRLHGLKTVDRSSR